MSVDSAVTDSVDGAADVNFISDEVDENISVFYLLFNAISIDDLL